MRLPVIEINIFPSTLNFTAKIFKGTESHSAYFIEQLDTLLVGGDMYGQEE